MGFLSKNKNKKKKEKAKIRAEREKKIERDKVKKALQREEDLRKAELINNNQIEIVKKIQKDMVDKNTPDVILEGKRGSKRRGVKRKTNTSSRKKPVKASKAQLMAKAKMKQYLAKKAKIKAKRGKK